MPCQSLLLLFLALLLDGLAFAPAKSSPRLCSRLRAIEPATLIRPKQAKTQSEPADFLLHQGLTATFMPKWPAIVTYSAVTNWTDETTDKFRYAMERVLGLNPILTGRLYRHRPFPLFHRKGDKFGLYIEPGYHADDVDKFVLVREAPPDMTNLAGMNCTNALRLIQHDIVPFMNIRCESSGEDIAKKNPLFGAHVLRFPNNTACLAIKMSHCLGDGLTYYHIVDQLMYFLRESNGDRAKHAPPPKVINWNHPMKATFECFPETFSRRDRYTAYGWPFYLGILRNVRRLVHPTYKKLMVMRRDKIAQAKQEYLKHCPSGTIISANDLITAGLCQSCESTDIFSFPLNMRGRKEGMMDKMAAGYLCCEIPFARTAALEPMSVREIVTKRQYYTTNELPRKPFLRGKNGRLSNFASVRSPDMFAENISGLQVICHCMPVNFFEIFPIDVCMIFAMDSQHIGVMHNFDKYHDTELLNNMTVFTMAAPAKE